MTVPLLLLLLLTDHLCHPASGSGSSFDVHLNDAATLQEANRVLAEEVKLAPRPQTYVLIDLVANTILLKSRAVELHRIPIRAWSADAPQAMTGSFLLTGRPPVPRPKIDPATKETQEPIALADMPVRYTLKFEPDLTIEVLPAGDRNPFRWIFRQVRVWWRGIHRWIGSLGPRKPSAAEPRLDLVLEEEQARSFAWALVDGMVVVIRRSTTHE